MLVHAFSHIYIQKGMSQPHPLCGMRQQFPCCIDEYGREKIRLAMHLKKKPSLQKYVIIVMQTMQCFGLRFESKHRLKVKLPSFLCLLACFGFWDFCITVWELNDSLSLLTFPLQRPFMLLAEREREKGRGFFCASLN